MGVLALLVLALLPNLGRAEDVGCSFRRPVAVCPEGLRYRPIDGSCNNLKHPELGSANTPLLRLVQPDYSDGVMSPRLSSKRRPLPSAQTIVTRLFPQENHTTFTTHLFVIWGQVLSHDFARIAVPRNEATGPCCDRGAGSECVSIAVRQDDPFYSQFDVTCLPLRRTNRTTCETRYAEQLSGVTHYLDLSFVYGSEAGTVRRLRAGCGGLLRTRLNRGQHFPPDVPNPRELCGHEPCYDSGDPRINQNPLLAAIQVLMLREHNRVARILAELNPKWDDDRLFEEARRVVVAEWQLITYRDWLQWLLGFDRIRETGMIPGTTTNSSEYREDMDPRTANDVTTGSYRSFHSMVQGQFWLGRAPTCSHFRRTALGKWFENPAPILEAKCGLLHALQGLTFQRSQDQDRWIDNEITRQLRPIFLKDGRRWGNDLVAIDIQRGRDHGVASYNKYREHVGLPRARDFGDLSDTLEERDIAGLRDLYEEVDDVDYYVGGVLERHRSGGALAGPTFQPFLEDQFTRWRFGDRFFYNFVGFEHSFSEEQLKALQGTSATRLMCDNIPGFKRGPFDPFIVIGHRGNREMSCQDVPRVDFSSWKE